MSHPFTIYATKPTRDAKVGLFFRNAIGGGVYISQIREDSLFNNNELQSGMLVESINDINCTSLKSNDVSAILRQVENQISMKVRPTPNAIPSAPPGIEVLPTPNDIPSAPSSVTVTSTKPTRETRVGIECQPINYDDRNGIYISTLSQDGIFASSLLQQGMVIDSINGVDCRSGMISAELADRMLREAEGVISIVAHEAASSSIFDTTFVTNPGIESATSYVGTYTSPVVSATTIENTNTNESGEIHYIVIGKWKCKGDYFLLNFFVVCFCGGGVILFFILRG